MMSSTASNSLIVEKMGQTALLRINRPKALNALTFELLAQLMESLLELDSDPDVHVMVITGSDKAFAAGADIRGFVGQDASAMKTEDQVGIFARINKVRKPVIAAVSGWALGGGCELALSCDMIIASDTAKFGQPEITLGLMPGAGATQRLARRIGKPLAMEMVLNNRTLSAAEALQFNLINAVYPVEDYLNAALKLAAEIAARVPLGVLGGKEAVNLAFELPMTEGLDTERQMFYNLFDSEDKEEGVTAFLEKRKAEWKGK